MKLGMITLGTVAFRMMTLSKTTFSKTTLIMILGTWHIA
jgi:hypothetical protein